jgi:citrate synthase
MSDDDAYWQTGVSDIGPNEVRIRGYRLDELMGDVPFTDIIHLTIKGELPTESEREIVNAALAGIVDHKFMSAAIPATRYTVSGNPNILAGVASGVLSMGEIAANPEVCAETLVEIVERTESDDRDLETVAREVVQDRMDEGKTVPGLGHPLHTADPRTVKLRNIAEEEGVVGDHLEAMDAIRDVFAEETGKELPINVDGMMATVLLDAGYEPPEIAGIAAISFLPGMIAQGVEELDERFSGIPDELTEYTGEEPRELPERYTAEADS